MSLEDAGARWMRHMREGEWEAAWRLSDSGIAARGGVVDWRAPRHLQHIWDGSPFTGRRVLVRCYHGLGDTIQFIRFVPLLAAIAAEVTVWAQPALLPLLATMRPAPRLLPLHDGTPEAEYDVDVEVMELLHAFRCTPTTLPADVPYLHPPARPRPGAAALAVGLVWRAGEWDPGRSIPVPLLLPLAHIPGVALHILQRGPALAEWPAGLGTVSGSDDPLEAASVMRSLDLVLSVDSMPAHLAGALGVPVWTLLQHRADWRWMDGRDASPWYPSMRLLRQPGAGRLGRGDGHRG
jgi:hypothetical protein